MILKYPQGMAFSQQATNLVPTPKWGLLSFCFYLSMLVAASGCSERIQKLQGYAQGTTYHISYWAETQVDDKQVKEAIETEFGTIDKLLSNYRNDSIIETFNSTENTDGFVVGGDIVSLVRIAQTVHKISQGCYDLTIKPLFDLWGFQNETQILPPEASIAKTMSQIGMEKLEIVNDTTLRKKQPDLKVDLSSIAQGYSVERMSQILEKHGVKDYLVEIGGELKTNGHKPDGQSWRIAVEKPLPGEQKLHKVIDMPKDSPLAVMTSGTYHHYFDENGVRYSHILDARTGRPVSHDLVSVSVIDPNPINADAWSTTLLCLGQEEGLKAANAENIIAFFIQQQNNELIESRSNALMDSKQLILH